MHTVIKPWLIAALVGALAGNVLLSAILIIKLGRYDEANRQAELVETQTKAKQEELASLKVQAETLSRQVETLKPTVEDWQKRLEEKARAEAAVKSLEASQHQIEADIAKASGQMEATSRILTQTEQQKTEAIANLEKLKSEQAVLAQTNVDLKSMLNSAAEAERRINAATNSLAISESRRQRLEIDLAAAQTRFDQIQKDADDLRKKRESLSGEVATLRQDLESLKDQITALDNQSGEVKAKQEAVQQEEQKLARARESLTAASTRINSLADQQSQIASDYAKLTNQVETARSSASDWEAKRVTNQQAAKTTELELAKVRADLQIAQDELAGVRKLANGLSTKQDDLTREVARQEALFEKLKTEKTILEKEVGRLEARQEATGKESIK
ncbi:MAG TPA: hypothetical protein VNN22_19520 [Verrucomicrobiae bacterium]|nr:hypothetical protein [Verrucomicrobiae bacterium]